jgi:hypothetical protein
MWLPWDYALVLAAVLGATSWFSRESKPVIAAWAREATIVAVLYSMWQFAGRITVTGIDRAVQRAEWLWDVERLLWLPNEYTLQQAMLPHSLTTQAANIYYAGAHVPAMGIFLVWLFGRYRGAYPTWRNTLALVTFLCLTIQLIPLAPPRLTPGLGLIDSGLAYGQSVYGALGRGSAGQYQAMPSIHIAWAALIGWAVFTVSASRWRWLGAAHFVLTFVVVAATGNHFWLDGIAAMVLLLPAWTVGRRIAEFSRAKILVPGLGEPTTTEAAV